jgi:hypothetical protein
MGEFAKKWMAGIAAAGVVVVIAAIAIGRMDRKPTLQSANSNINAVAKAAPVAATTVQPSAPQVATSPNPSTPEKAGVESAAIAQVAAEKSVAAPSHVASSRAQPHIAHPTNTSSNGVAQVHSPVASEHAATQPVAQNQVQAAQSQPPLSPPDTATPPAQQLAAPETTAQVMPVNRTGGMKTTGSVNVNGSFTKSSTLVYADDQIVTPGQNGALVTAPGNAVALGPGAQFTAQPNAFALDSGASNVNTSTGMAAKVKAYTITPVDPKLATHYEVNWESDGVYVYARTGDVDITGPCNRSWRLEEGKAVKIPSPLRCDPLVWLNGGRVLPYAVAWGSAAAAGTGVIIYLSRHPSMSGSAPSN